MATCGPGIVTYVDCYIKAPSELNCGELPTNHRVTLLSASSYHVLLKRKCAADIPLPGALVPRDEFKRKLFKLSPLQHRCPRCSYADDHI
jgi:hypothetical protein